MNSTKGGKDAMNEGTRAAIEALLKSDGTITPAHRREVLLTVDTFTEAGKAPDPEPMLSPAEAAARLRITRRTLFRWIEAGMFHPVRYTARKIALRLSEITAFEQTGGATIDTRPARKQARKERPPVSPLKISQVPERLRAAMKHVAKMKRNKTGKTP